MSANARLQALGIDLPASTAPIGAYVPALQVGSLIITSGQLPMVEGRLSNSGKVPADVTLQEAARAARIAALNALAALAAVAGDLDHIERMVRLGVFVNSSPGFTDQAGVANGASELLIDVFGDRGRHVRAAVGVSELPLGAVVELELAAMLRRG